MSLMPDPRNHLKLVKLLIEREMLIASIAINTARLTRHNYKHLNTPATATPETPKKATKAPVMAYRNFSN